MSKTYQKPKQIATGYYYFGSIDKQGELITREAIEKAPLPPPGAQITYMFDPKRIVGTLIEARKNFEQNRLEFDVELTEQGLLATGFAITGFMKERIFTTSREGLSYYKIKDLEIRQASVVPNPVDDRNRVDLGTRHDLVCFLDGNTLCVVGKNFVNIAESEALFLNLSADQLAAIRRLENA